MKKFAKGYFSIILIVAISFMGWSYLQERGMINVKKEEESAIKVACIGDSLTFLRSLEDERFINYPTMLQEVLGDRYDVTNYGQAGTCVNTKGNYPYNSLRVYDCSVDSESDIVIIMIGTNDVWDHNWVDAEHFRNEYMELIESYMQVEEKPKLYLCTIPKIFLEDGSILENGYGERIEILSNVIREIGNEKGYHIIDMNHITSQHPEWYWKDFLHFSNEGANEIANVIAEELLMEY